MCLKVPTYGSLPRLRRHALTRESTKGGSFRSPGVVPVHQAWWDCLEGVNVNVGGHCCFLSTDGMSAVCGCSGIVRGGTSSSGEITSPAHQNTVSSIGSFQGTKIGGETSVIETKLLTA